MIVYIEGKIISKLVDKVVINVNGLGYECGISGSTFEDLPEEGKSVSLYTYLSISENSHNLFGFSTLNEKKL